MWSTRYSCEILNLNYLDIRGIFINPQIPNFMKIRPVGAEFFHAETDGHVEANSRFSQFCERA
jgi:hypothetical protein